MKRESKYYTPHIDEFCVGFEYEVVSEDTPIGKDKDVHTTFPLSFDKNTTKHIFPDPYYGFDIEKLMRNKEVRVKFLDADDVISTGFKLAEEGKDFQRFKRVVNMGSSPTLIELSLSYYNDFPAISMSENDEVYVNRMICLNINELKWILARMKIA